MSKRLRYPLAVGLLMSLVAALGAQEDEARALVLKAVKAQGGLDKLSQKVAAHRKSKGIFHTDKFSFTGESFSDAGGQRRKIAIVGEQDGQVSTRTLVLENGKGFITFDGITVDLDADFLERLEKSSYADKVSSLVTLLKDKGYKLFTTGEIQIKNAPALGVKVEKEGKPDVHLYFDKVSGLLVKSANKVKDSDGSPEVLQEVYYGDYQWFRPLAADEKLLLAAKLNVDGPALLQALRQRIPTAEDQKNIQERISQIGSKNFKVRERASTELKRLGTKAAPQLREALNHKDKEVAIRAEKLLEQVTQGPDVDLAMALLRLMNGRRPSGAAAVLLDYLPHAPNDKTSQFVLEALAAVAVQDGKVDPAIEQALHDKNPSRRAAAAAVLGKDGGVFAKQPWRPVLVDGVLLSRTANLYRDGRLHMDLETLEVHYYNRLDDSVFARP